MRTLTEIIESVKDGEKPEYEELRYALLVRDMAASDLYLFLLMEVFAKLPLTGMQKFRVENKLKNVANANDKDPKVYIGSLDPDYPGRQLERSIHKKIGEKFLAAADAGKGD